MNPVKNERDAVRAAFLPLDCSGKSIKRVFELEPGTALDNAGGFETYVQAGIKRSSISPRPIEGAETVFELVTFPAIAPLRLQRADPFTGTDYEDREPVGSAERRMLQQPLLKHPGLTKFEIKAREYYIATLTHFFEEQLPPELQAEIAAVILAPDPADVACEETHQVYENRDPEAVHRKYADRVKITDAGDIRVSSDYVTRCCQLLEKSQSQNAIDYRDKLSYLQFKRGDLVIPKEQFRLHLAEYGWYGWAKLVNIAYNTLTATDVERLVTATPNVDADLLRQFQSNTTVYSPFYGTTDTKNPKREWKTRTDSTLTTRPLNIQDKRLMTVVDCIRAFQHLDFNTPIRIDTLFRYLRIFFPAPHRPGNDIGDKETLKNALRAAADDRVKFDEHNETDELICSIPAPKFCPYYPTTTPNAWDYYLKARAKQSTATPDRQQRTADGAHCNRIHPILPPEYAPTFPDTYDTKVGLTQETAVTTQPAVASVQNTQPLVDPATLPTLTRDQIVFLTRVSLTMERLLNGASLTRSMLSLRCDANGDELQIDESKLLNQGWLEKHDEGTSVLYTVPYNKRRQLGVENIAHDGYGEKTPSEKSLHRKGVDSCAVALAAKPDVTRVIRYFDLWRLRSTSCEPALAAEDLFSTRVDVIAFSGTTPKYAVGVETASNAASKPQRCVQKLAALSKTLETWLVTPNSHHLWNVMTHLNDPDHLDFDTFPQSSADSYSRSNWERELDAEGFLGDYFDTLHTYRSLNTTPDAETHTPHDKIVGRI